MKKSSIFYYNFILAVFFTSILGQSANNVLADPIPKPQIELNHFYNYNDPHVGYTYEHHGFGVRHYNNQGLEHGDVDPIMTTLLESRKYLQITGPVETDRLRYSMNVRTWYIERIYLAQFTFYDIRILCLGEEISIDLVECESFGAYLTDVVPDEDKWYIPENIGDTATFHCVYFFNDIGLETYGNGESKISMTMDHKITLGNGVSEIKIDIIVDTEDLRIFNSSNQQEVTSGTEYSLEIEYTMSLSESDTENECGDIVIPSEITENAVVYHVTDDEGNPITTSTLEMGTSFKDYYSESVYYTRQASSNIYLDQVEGNHVYAKHTFAGLTYGTTIKMWSDPKISMYHKANTIPDETSTKTTPEISPSFTFVPLILLLLPLIVYKRKRV